MSCFCTFALLISWCVIAFANYLFFILGCVYLLIAYWMVSVHKWKPNKTPILEVFCAKTPMKEIWTNENQTKHPRYEGSGSPRIMVYDAQYCFIIWDLPYYNAILCNINHNAW